MDENLLWVSAGYALLTVAICAFEVQRTRTSGPDVLSLFMVLFLLQCCLPGIVIFACLPFTGLYLPTDIPAFDRIFTAINLPSALLVLGLTAAFAFFLYVFMALGRIIMRRLVPASPGRAWLLLRGSPAWLLLVIIFGLALTLIAFWGMGDTLVDRYVNLIELRAYSDQAKSSTLDTVAFLLIQSWGWLSVVTLFVLFERRGRSPAWYFCCGCAVIFAILAASRRAIFLPVLLVYLTFVLFDGRWRVKFLVFASIPILLWVAFGKEALATVVSGGAAATVVSEYQSPIAGVLRTASEVGITVVESLGSITLLDLPPRFGVDHILSVLRGAPIGWILHWLGLDRSMPVRIVRLSTEAFATPYDQDIPPGLFGQMWLDFRVFGPVVWAFVFAAQLSIVQQFFVLALKTREAAAAFVLITFIIALPVNSGSYDFSVGEDVVAMMLCMFLAFKFIRVHLPPLGERVSD